MKTLNQVFVALLCLLFFQQTTFAQRIITPKRTTSTSTKQSVRSFAATASASQWIARHNLSHSSYQSEFTKHSSRGYRLVHIAGYEVAGKARYAAIWEKKSGPAMKTHHGMTSAVYQQKFSAYANAGYRLSHLSAYDVRGKDYYAAIWEKKSGPAWVSKHRMTATQYQQEYNNRKAQGYRLTQVSGYALNKSARYAAIWVKSSGPSMRTHHGMSSASYQSKFNTYAKQGFRLSCLSGYTVNGKDYYAAIWEKKAGAAQSARHRLSAANYQQEFDNHTYTAYRPVLVTGYTIGGKARYAAVWQAGQMKTSDLKNISNLVGNFMNKHNIPGVQVAVSRNGKLVFARGYGKADQEKNILMGPHLKGRIASISKPITSAAIMKLNAQNNSFNLNSRVVGPGSIFGNTYGNRNYSNRERNIRVVNLLEHTAGANVWDNNTDLDHSNTDPKAKEPNQTSDPMFQNTNMNHAQLFGWVLNNRNPDYNPGTYYAYSNFGYSMLGRIIENRTGQSYENWVKNNILKPAGAGGMFISRNSKAQKRSNEMVYYGVNGNNPYGSNVQRMDSHGGWAGSVIDLLNFMSRVDGNAGKKDLLTGSQINQMKSRTSYAANPVYTRNYGKGWGLLSGDGVNHSGSLEGTYSLLEYRSNGIAIAIILNSNARTDAFRDDFFQLDNQIVNAISKWPTHDLF